MGITGYQVRNAKWDQVYHYASGKTEFTIFACDAFPGMTMTMDKKGKKLVKSYRVDGKNTDSMLTAIRWYNEKDKRERGRHVAAGSPEQIKLRKTALTGHGN